MLTTAFRLKCIAMLLVCCVCTCAAQTNAAIDTLVQKLKDPRTTDVAFGQLEIMKHVSDQDRQTLTREIQGIIPQRDPRSVWINAVRIAGALKLDGTVPLLAEQLTSPETKVDGWITMSREMNLGNDPAGKSLAQIGEPAVPYVSKELNDGDRETRFRAAYVLAQIDSPLADEALRTHLPNEKDPGLVNFITIILKKHAHS